MLETSKCPENNNLSMDNEYADGYACPHCNAYLLDHPELKLWKKCPGCGYCTKDNKRIVYIVGGREKDEGNH